MTQSKNAFNEFTQSSMPPESIAANDNINPAIDIKDYQDDMNELGWSEEDLIAYIKTIDDILVTCVHIRWDVANVHLPIPKSAINENQSNNTELKEVNGKKG